ncbi:MAG: lamin tail domain-containing protein, partial [Bacteroidota bacterium]
GWRLTALDGEPNIHLTGMIPARGFFLLERGHDTTVSDIPADQIYTGALSDTVERLYLYNSAGSIVDYANTFKTTWVAGSVANNRSMERRGPFYDGPTTWVTNTGVYRNGKDADGDPINGTPKRANWATIVTLTPSPRPTIYPSRTLPPQPRPVINEFLPRAAFDWNQDGRVDVFDEFIEIANLGPVDVNLSGWKLDDEPNAGSDPYTLPSMVLKPGERALFYGLQTNILLSDGGDTVRLLSPTNVVFDAQTYGVVTVADQSWCRLPDLRGSWFSDCFPTPNQPNQRKGQVPSLPPGTGLEEPLCLLADTLPSDFLLAECHGFGEDMFSSLYWDRNGWWFDFPVRQNGSKWQTFVE